MAANPTFEMDLESFPKFTYAFDTASPPVNSLLGEARSSESGCTKHFNTPLIPFYNYGRKKDIQHRFEEVQKIRLCLHSSLKRTVNKGKSRKRNAGI